jgi:uncharacterized protein with HEPN domain
VGEAVGPVSEEKRNQIAIVPWKAIIVMRNILVHRYFNLDEEALWKVVRVDPGQLLEILRRAINHR